MRFKPLQQKWPDVFLQRTVEVGWRLLWFLSFLGASGQTLVVAAEEVSTVPIYVRTLSATGTVCELARSDVREQFLARFRRMSQKPLDDSHLVSLQGLSTWEISFSGFSEEAESAFQFAANIWAEFISSPVAIRVDAEFVDMDEPDVLGGAGPTVLIRNFTGDVPDTYFSVSLANFLAGNDLSSQDDIQVSINSGFPNWYFGIDGNPGSNEIDFVSVVLHELAHGLGFSDSFHVNNSNIGSWGVGEYPVIYDRFVEDYLGRNLIDTDLYPQSSITLGTALTGDTFLVGANSMDVVLFSPSSFEVGSSIAHLDESTYPAEGENSLMTPYLSSSESQHDPGAVVKGIFQDLGWSWLNLVVNHSPFANAGPEREVNEQEFITLNDASGFDPDGDNLSFSWNQIIGPTVSFNEISQTPSFQAPETDGETIIVLELTVSDGFVSDSDLVNIRVLDLDINHPPKAAAGPNQTVDEGEVVILDGGSSSDIEGDELSFQWEQQFGPMVQLLNSSSSLTTFVAPGVDSNTTLRFCLTVDDGQASDKDNIDILVRNGAGNLPPVADAGSDQIVEEGEEVWLDGTSSFDPNGDDLTFNWSQVSGPTVIFSDSGSGSLMFQAPTVEENSVLVFELTVNDGVLSDSDVVSIIVNDVESIIDFAQFAFGSGLTSELFLVSLTSTSVTEAVVLMTTSDGDPWSLSLNEMEVNGQLEVSVPPGGFIHLMTVSDGPVESGSIRVVSDQTLDGLILFTGPFGLAGIPPGTSSKQGFRTLVETNVHKTIDTGFSVVNLEDESALLDIDLLDLEGNLVSTAATDVNLLELEGRGQRSLFVTDLDFSPPVDFSTFLGILRTKSDREVGATAIQTRPGEFAALPVTSEESISSESMDMAFSQALDFAQFADGEGLTSQIYLMNLANTADASVLAIARDMEGEILPVDLLDATDDQPAAGIIPANGGQVSRTRGEGVLQAGSLKIETTQPLSGTILFGGDFGLAGVPSSGIMESGFRTIIQIDAEKEINTGVAIVNLGNESISLEPALFDASGFKIEILDTPHVISILPGGQMRFFITDFSWAEESLDNFVGILEIKSTGLVGATAIQTRPGQFAALPVTRLPD